MPASSFFRSVLFTGTFVLIFSVISASAQSTNIEFPTPVSANEISGKINARDLGDPRLTSHYYVFEGSQGDVLIRVETANFDGDVDVFNAQGLRPITKMSFISGTSLTESVREIYLRKSEKMILRIEGRSTNEEAATYRVRFEGSFRPSAETVAETPDAPQVKTETEGAVRVNSVGTIIETKREEKELNAESEAEKAETSAVLETPTEKTPERTEKATTAPENKDEEISAEKRAETNVPPRARRNARLNGRPARRTPPAASSSRRTTVPPKTSAPDPLANVRLMIVMKVGETIEHPINQVQRFSVERGVLTIIMKTGSISRIPVKDISQMTVQ